MFVLMIGVHSLLEYPLWYAYFLLPAAWAWGFALAAGSEPDRAAAARAPALAVGMLRRGRGVCVVDYQRVVRIFEAPADAPPLAQRIARRASAAGSSPTTPTTPRPPPGCRSPTAWRPSTAPSTTCWTPG